jgi:signal transduction histidine kinase
MVQQRSRATNRTSHDGSGLGLAIVDSIAAIHDATVAACPNPGGGLVVDITFPPPGQPPRRSPEKMGRQTGR